MSFEALGGSIRADLIDAMQREWVRLGRPGTWWSAGERVAIAAAARRAQAGTHDESSAVPQPPVGNVATEAARRLAVAAATTTRDVVAGQPAGGLEHPPYVELVGVVSRVAAVDATHRALGFEL